MVSRWKKWLHHYGRLDEPLKSKPHREHSFMPNQSESSANQFETLSDRAPQMRYPDTQSMPPARTVSCGRASSGKAGAAGPTDDLDMGRRGSRPKNTPQTGECIGEVSEQERTWAHSSEDVGRPGA